MYFPCVQLRQGMFGRWGTDDRKCQELLSLVTDQAARKDALVGRFYVAHGLDSLESCLRFARIHCWSVSHLRPPVNFNHQFFRLMIHLLLSHWISRQDVSPIESDHPGAPRTFPWSCDHSLQHLAAGGAAEATLWWECQGERWSRRSWDWPYVCLVCQTSRFRFC